MITTTLRKPRCSNEGNIEPCTCVFNPALTRKCDFNALDNEIAVDNRRLVWFGVKWSGLNGEGLISVITDSLHSRRSIERGARERSQPRDEK